jgi:AcrR family transcriptional regulator
VPRGKTSGGEEARARILEAAEEVFANKGFHGASIRELAKAAGMATASMLHHFPSKPKLYGAVLGTISRDLEARVDPLMATPGPLDETLHALGEALIDWTEEEPRRSKLLLREMLDNPERIRKAEHLPLAGFLNSVSSFLRKAKARGELQDIDPDLFFHHVVGAALYVPVAMPTIARVTPRRSEAALRKAHRRTLRDWIARVASSKSE